MRLLGVVALCVVLLTALIFGYERRHEISNRLADGVENLIFRQEAEIDASAAGLDPERLESGLAKIAMREGGSLTTLTSFPDFARVSFDMPQSVEARSGEIFLEIAGELNEGAEGLMRISVNGVRRAAIVLDEGIIQRKFVMPLNTRELAAEKLTVSLAVEGRTPQVACTAEWNGGVALQVLPSSHLSLQLNGVVSDPRDKLLLAGAPTKLIWPDASVDAQAQALRVAHQLFERDRNSLFVDPQSNEFALSQDDIAALDAEALPPVERVHQTRSDLAAGLGQRRAQTFERETRLRMPFDLAVLDGQVKALDLEMQYASAQDNDASWLLSVFLNDRLVHAEGTLSSTGVFKQRIALPAAYLTGEQNTISMTLQNGAIHQNLCATGVPTVLDVRRAELVLDQAYENNNEPSLRTALQAQLALQVPSAVSLYDAQIAFETLKSLSSIQDLDLQFAATRDTAKTEVSVIPRGELHDALAKNETDKTWLVYMARDDDNRLVIMNGAEASAVPIQDLPRAVLIVIDLLGKGT